MKACGGKKVFTCLRVLVLPLRKVARMQVVLGPCLIGHVIVKQIVYCKMLLFLNSYSAVLLCSYDHEQTIPLLRVNYCSIVSKLHRC